MTLKRWLTVVVLSCSDLGVEVANRIQGITGVDKVTLITTPYKRKQMSLPGKIRHIYRYQGVIGLTRVLRHKLLSSWKMERDGEAIIDSLLNKGTMHYRFQDFHDLDCVETLKKLQPELGVIAGTYILKETVFGVPRLGSINLHTGKVPAYRGAAPAFWEMYNGETNVGITIHRVVASVDAGSVLLQESFPMDNAPEGDPLSYIENYRKEVLMPNGIRMLAAVVSMVADGTLDERPQDSTKAITYKTPDYKTICELRRRVKERRRKGMVI